jgi:hypothetical protein
MISLEELQLYIGAPEDGVDSETLLTQLEVEAVALVQQATGRYFGASGSITWYLDGGGQTSIFLPDYVTAISEVSYRGSLVSAFTTLDVDTGYFLNGSQLFRVDGTAFPDGEALVKVTATRGYAANAEPQPIRQLVKDLVNFYYRGARKLFLEDAGSPDFTVVPGWDRVINLYRRPLIG